MGATLKVTEAKAFLLWLEIYKEFRVGLRTVVYNELTVVLGATAGNNRIERLAWNRARTLLCTVASARWAASSFHCCRSVVCITQQHTSVNDQMLPLRVPISLCVLHRFAAVLCEIGTCSIQAPHVCHAGIKAMRRDRFGNVGRCPMKHEDLVLSLIQHIQV